MHRRNGVSLLSRRCVLLILAALVPLSMGSSNLSYKSHSFLSARHKVHKWPRILMLRGGSGRGGDRMQVDAGSGRPSTAPKETSFTLHDTQQVEAQPAAQTVHIEMKKIRKEEEIKKRAESLAASWAADVVRKDVTPKGNGTIWVFAGRQHEVSMFGVRTTMRWNASEEFWEYMPPLKYERINCAAVKLGRKIYVAGGWHTTCEYHSSSPGPLDQPCTHNLYHSHHATHYHKEKKNFHACHAWLLSHILNTPHEFWQYRPCER
jgi:hypothetical protein